LGIPVGSATGAADMSCVPMGRAQHRLIGDDVGRFGDWGSVVAASAFSPHDQLAVATVHCAEAVCDGYGAAVLVENGRAVLVPENVLAECVSLAHNLQCTALQTGLSSSAPEYPVGGYVGSGFVVECVGVGVIDRWRRRFVGRRRHMVDASAASFRFAAGR